MNKKDKLLEQLLNRPGAADYFRRKKAENSQRDDSFWIVGTSHKAFGEARAEDDFYELVDSALEQGLSYDDLCQAIEDDERVTNEALYPALAMTHDGQARTEEDFGAIVTNAVMSGVPYEDLCRAIENAMETDAVMAAITTKGLKMSEDDVVDLFYEALIRVSPQVRQRTVKALKGFYAQNTDSFWDGGPDPRGGPFNKSPLEGGIGRLKPSQRPTPPGWGDPNGTAEFTRKRAQGRR